MCTSSSKMHLRTLGCGGGAAVRVVGVKILQHGQAFIDIDPVTPQDLPLARTVAPVPATATRLAYAGE